MSATVTQWFSGYPEHVGDYQVVHKSRLAPEKILMHYFDGHKFWPVLPVPYSYIEAYGDQWRGLASQPDREKKS